jgi:hypothetical protein
VLSVYLLIVDSTDLTHLNLSLYEEVVNEEALTLKNSADRAASD